MFDIIGTIISVAVSMTLILLLRHADKGNRSLEKIKKYTDRVRSEFDSYFIQQEEKLKNMSVITESNTDKSVAVVKRLEKQYEDFAARRNVLDQRFQMMNDIESRLSAYKEASQQVFEMTTRLEQNLENLHKESEIIDQVSKKIAAQKQSVATLESKISETIGKGRPWEEALPGVTRAIEWAKDPQTAARQEISQARGKGTLINLAQNPCFEDCPKESDRLFYAARQPAQPPAHRFWFGFPVSTLRSCRRPDTDC